MDGTCSTNRGGMHLGFWLESQNERDIYEDLDVCGRIIIKWIFKRQNDVVMDWDQRRALLNTVLNSGIP
jgi:hypothetical protein